MLRGTSARANKDTTFGLSAPPGQHPTRHTPAAWAGGRRHKAAARTADAGMTQNCERNPAGDEVWPLGDSRKSSVSSVVPMASMVNAKAAVTLGPSNRSREGPTGVAPTTAAPATSAGKLSVMDLLRPIVIMGLRIGVRSDAPSGARDAPSSARGGVRRAAAQARQRERRSIVSMHGRVQSYVAAAMRATTVSHLRAAYKPRARRLVLVICLLGVLHAASLGKTDFISRLKSSARGPRRRGGREVLSSHKPPQEQARRRDENALNFCWPRK